MKSIKEIMKEIEQIRYFQDVEMSKLYQFSTRNAVETAIDMVKDDKQSRWIELFKKSVSSSKK